MVTGMIKCELDKEFSITLLRFRHMSKFFLLCNCNQLRVYLSLELFTTGVWHNVKVDNIHQTIWSAAAFISIEKIGVYLAESALGQQTECRLLPGFISSSQPVHFAVLLVHYSFSSFSVLYIVLYSSLTWHAITVSEPLSFIWLRPLAIDCYLGSHLW